MNNLGKNDKQTAKKPPHRVGPNDGKKFTKEYQPKPERKSMGWKKLRAQRLLTQSIFSEFFKDDGGEKPSFKDFKRKLIANANKGNPKALEIIHKCIEEDIQKMQVTGIKVGKELADEKYD